MDNILDEIEPPQKTKSTFAILSMVSGIVTVLTFGKAIKLFSITVKASETLTPPSILEVSIVFWSWLLGLMFIVLSYLTKEPVSWMKIIGTSYNAIVLVLIIGLSLLSFLQ